MKAEVFWSLVLSSASLIPGSGCILDKPVINPRFCELAPSGIAVMPVENRTVLDLARVSTAGLLQRFTIGSREVDVPEVLQEALVGGLDRKGYGARSIPSTGNEPDYRRPVLGELPAFDAALYCDITDWRIESPSSGGDISISGAVALVRIADASHEGGEVLYEGRFHHRTSSLSDGIRTSADLEAEVRRAGLSAIAELPPASSAAAPPPPPPGKGATGSPGTPSPGRGALPGPGGSPR